MELFIPAFIAGILTFLAPCTLPLVPGYLAFISNVPLKDEQRPRNRIFKNGLAFVLGFSIVFIILGLVAGLIGYAFAPYQIWLSRFSGVMIILFGFFMLGLFDIPFLKQEKRLIVPAFFKRGSLAGSFLFGSAFSLGWTPCVGPILGSILLLASSTATVLKGALLLGTFALGLAVPFLLVALSIKQAEKYISRLAVYLKIITIFGGIFLIIIGFLVLTNNLAHFLSWSYSAFQFIGYNQLIEHL